MDKHCEFLVTCEHGGNRIPAHYRNYFAGQEDLLESHRAHDAGALAMARDMARQLGAALLYSTISRLLVDLNRSPGHPKLHAEAIRRMPAQNRQRILEQHYLPFRTKTEAAVARSIAHGKRVIHLSSHSFTPVLDGITRLADIGLLYDPSRANEAALCKEWLACLKNLEPSLRVRRNYPYSGKSDGFTAFLRRRFSADNYMGIELEINQGLTLAGRQPWRRLRAIVAESLVQALKKSICKQPL